jgi:hypothetical protein
MIGNMSFEMRLMGIGKLKVLEKDGDQALAVAATVLYAELAAGCWASAEDFRESYPDVALDGSRARIILAGGYVVDLTVNFLTGMLIIDDAGRLSQSEPRRASAGRAA